MNENINNDILQKRKKASLSLGKRIFINIVLVIIMIAFIFPIVWMGIISFKTQGQIQSMPPSVFSPFTLDNYREIFGTNVKATTDKARSQAVSEVIKMRSESFLRSLLNSAILSVSSVAIAAVIGVIAAYGLSRYKNKNKEQLGFIFLSFRFVPELAILIPLYIIYQKLMLYDTYFGLIWVYILIPLPMIIWITRTYFDDLPIELEQAAMLDGYSKVKIFFKIVLPLVKPGLAASIILSFIYAWNSLIFGLVLAANRIQPVTARILNFSDITDPSYGRVAAAIIIAILPMIIISQIASKYLVSGLSLGAIKG